MDYLLTVRVGLVNHMETANERKWRNGLCK